ncbi:MAG: transcriptional regulator GcvA [Rhizobiaceae bacterium]|nr:transcriptional regulator GcvA [Rhizobiaceae bacterium]
MAYRLPSLNSLRAFEAAARLLSFQKAAEELFVTPSALSYQIRQLEEYIETPLFNRLNRAVTLTEAGRRLYPGVHDGFESLQGAVRTVEHSRQSNVLVVSSGPAFGAKWLAPRVYRFVDAHPDIELRIAASLKLTDFNTDEVDVALRFGEGDYPGLFAEPLFDELALPLISPDLVDKFGGTFGPEDLAKVTLLHDDASSFTTEVVDWTNWLEQEGLGHIDGTKGPRFNHADHGLDAAVDGAGIVLGRLSLAMRDIRSGRLVAPFDTYVKATVGFHFVVPPSSLDLPHVATFYKWLRAEADAEIQEVSKFLATKRSR